MTAAPAILRACITGSWASLAELLACPNLAAAMAHPHAPLLELRLDQLADATPSTLAVAVGRFGPSRLVVTCRHPAAVGPGKTTTLGQAERRLLWRQAHRLGAAFIDVDLEDWAADPALRAALRAPSAAAGPGPQVVVSLHDFAAVPPLEQLWGHYQNAAALGAHLFKVAAQVRSAEEALPLVQLLGRVEAARRGSARPLPGLLPLAMGSAGSWTRSLVARQSVPAPFTYVCLAPGAGTAAGQPTLAEVVAMPDLGGLAPASPLYGLLGAPVGHSRSPALHNQVLRQAGRAGLYLAFEVPGSPEAFLRQLAPALGIRGLSVTLPHKAAVAASCWRRDAVAEASGAINTLVADAKGQGSQAALRPYSGTNTDGPALLASLRRAWGGPLAGQRALVLGTGGTAAVAVAALGAAGARVAVWGRRPAAAAALALGRGAVAVGPEGLNAALADTHILVHATPVGMAPAMDAAPLSERQLAFLPASALVFDAIYTPAPTLLLRRAAARGLATLDGLDMFLRQAQGQCRAFYGLRPELHHLAAILAGRGPPGR